MIGSRDISVVVRGLVVGGPSDPAEEQHTRRCLQSVRAHLPGAELILSTWRGSDVAGLDFDMLVENDDPGPSLALDLSPNVFRQVVASQGGLAAATRPYTLLIRSDLVLTHDGLLAQFACWKGVSREPDYAILKERVALLTTCNPRRRSRFPFNACDWLYLGRTEDVRDIFAIPLERHERLMTGPEGVERIVVTPYSSEQFIWFSFLAKHRSIDFKRFDDARESMIGLSEAYFANNVILLTARMAGADWLKYPGAAYAQVPCLSNSGLYTWTEYKRMLNRHAGANLTIIPNPLEELVYATVYPFRFWLRSRNRALYDRIVRLVNRENHERVDRNRAKRP